MTRVADRRCAVILHALVVVMVVGCIHDHYECAVDAECNLMAGGRCEADHHCTEPDVKCAVGRSYSSHSGAESGTCWPGTAELQNVCAGGQPAAVATGCAALVCGALPTCCTTGWGDACVLEAERTCQTVCNTWIAITATKAGPYTELWDLRYDGATWTAKERQDRHGVLSYLAPAPGTGQPRISGFIGTDNALAVGDPPAETDYVLPRDHKYSDVSSVDLDRDLRDTVALSWQDSNTPINSFIEVLKLGGGDVRQIPTPAAIRQCWGDDDHDAFPDAVAGSGTRYNFLDNIPGADHQRSLEGLVSSNFGGAGTAGAPNVRSFEWADLDGDGLLDLVAFGNSLRTHLSAARLSDQATLNIDCDPPVTNPFGTGCDPSLASFAGAVLPSTAGTDIIAATSPGRGVYRIHPHGTTADIAPIMVGVAPCGTMCPPILAVVTRDLDGDHLLDIIAIDSSLEVYVGLTTVDPTLSRLVHQHPISTPTIGFTAVRASVSGAPR